MRRLFAVSAAVCVLLGTVLRSGASQTAGTVSDPAVPLSYIQNTYTAMITEQTGARLGAAVADTLTGGIAGLKNKVDAVGLDKIEPALVNAALAELNTKLQLTTGPKLLSLPAGAGVALAEGSYLTLLSGTLKQTSGAVVNLKSEADTAALRQKCLIPQGGAMFTAEGGPVSLLADGRYISFTPPPYRAKYTDLADALKTVRLFLGTADGSYALTRAPTRVEGLVMMIRLFGLEEEAKACTLGHPFKDVPDWAAPYVAYAYENGLTNGTSAENYSPNRALTPDQYCTYVLRALGYTDPADFSWDKALSYCEQRGFLSASESKLVKEPFYRDQMVYISFYALDMKVKGSGVTLLQKLVENGAVDGGMAVKALSAVDRTRP